MSKIKAVLTSILNILLFIPRKCVAGVKYVYYSIREFIFIIIAVHIFGIQFVRDRLIWGRRKTQPNFTKVVPRVHEVIKDPVQVLYEECQKTSNGTSFLGRTYYKKSDKAIEALADLMCPHGEFGCGKADCNLTTNQRITNFENKREQLKKDYVMNTFPRNHRWRLEFGNKKDDAMLLWAQSAKITRKASFFKKGLIEVIFYVKPELIDYFARKPKTKVARISLTEGDGSLMSYIEFSKFKLKDVDFSSLDFDYTKTDITTVKAVFSFKKSKFFGTVTVNGPIEKAVV